MPTTARWERFSAMTDGWIASSDEIHSFGRDMLEAGMFKPRNYTDLDGLDTARNLLDFFEKPWHWNREHTWWLANDRPDSEEAWEQGYDDGFEVEGE